MQPNNKMRLPLAVIVAMNAMIGASLFTLPAALSLLVGPAAIASYALVVLLVIAIALALIRVNAQYPSSFPVYTHAAAWGGAIAGTISSFCYIAGLTVALGLLARIAGAYIHTYIPATSAPVWMLGSTWLFVGCNLFGAAIAQLLQYALIALTLLPMLLIIILCARYFSFANYVPFAPYGIKSILLASQAVIFGFFGFEVIPAMSAHVDNARKTVPRAMILAIILTGLVYILFIGSIFGAIPVTVFTSAQMPLSQALLFLYPTHHWLGFVIDWAVIVTVWGTMLSMIMAIASLFSELAGISSKKSLILLGCAISAVGLIFSNIETLFALVALCITISYTMSIVALFFMTGRKKSNIALGFIGCSASFLVMYCALEKLFTILF